MVDAVSLLSGLPPALNGKEQWLAAGRSLISAGAVEEAELLLLTLGQAYDNDVKLQVLLVGLALRTGRWTEALTTARRALAQAEKLVAAPDVRASAAVALAVALGHVARCTPVMAPTQRSDCRAEARALIEPLVGPESSCANSGSVERRSVLSGAARAEALYCLAVLNAEGGHFRAAIEAAREALAACPPSGGINAAAPSNPLATTPGANGNSDEEVCSLLLRPAVLGLLALLLSPHQPKPAVLLVDAALACCPATGSILPAAGTGGGTTGLRVGVTRGMDVTLLRIKAQLLLALADPGSALEVLAAAKQRLGAARQAARGGEGDEGAAREYAIMEAQVWRELALAYASQKQQGDADVCVKQAELIDPHSADTAHVTGVVAEAAGNSEAALDAFEMALALDPSHAPSLRSLGTLLRRHRGSFNTVVARSLLADALRYDSANYSGWYSYGSIETGAEAERHLCHAVTLAAAAPIVDCGQLPLLL